MYVNIFYTFTFKVSIKPTISKICLSDNAIGKMCFVDINTSRKVLNISEIYL